MENEGLKTLNDLLLLGYKLQYSTNEHWVIDPNGEKLMGFPKGDLMEERYFAVDTKGNVTAVFL